METRSKERILLVESDPDICDLVARQALEPLGYQVQLAGDVNSAIQSAARHAPHLVIADLNLPGLSGKDLLVALNSQGIQVPVIVIAKQGQEKNVIQAFRLGGSDYLVWPVRETEVVTVVERALKQVHEKELRAHVDQQLKESNLEMEHRVRELTTIFAIGKAVISITDQRMLFDKIVEGMLYVSEADYGWLLLRDERSRAFVLTCQRNLPEPWARKMGSPLDDGVSSLVALSGETLAIHGEPLKRFRASNLGKSLVVVPVKVLQEVIGLLVVVRKNDVPFDKNMQMLVEAIADYASVSLVKDHLFRALKGRAESAQAGEKAGLSQLEATHQELRDLLQPVTYPVELLMSGKMGTLNSDQKTALKSIQTALLHALKVVTKKDAQEGGG